jgi:hypothetical protein
MKGPTVRRNGDGSARLTENPPRSRVAGRMICSTRAFEANVIFLSSLNDPQVSPTAMWMLLSSLKLELVACGKN